MSLPTTHCRVCQVSKQSVACMPVTTILLSSMGVVSCPLAVSTRLMSASPAIRLYLTVMMSPSCRSKQVLNRCRYCSSQLPSMQSSEPPHHASSHVKWASSPCRAALSLSRPSSDEAVHHLQVGRWSCRPMLYQGLLLVRCPSQLKNLPLPRLKLVTNGSSVKSHSRALRAVVKCDMPKNSVLSVW